MAAAAGLGTPRVAAQTRRRRPALSDRSGTQRTPRGTTFAQAQGYAVGHPGRGVSKNGGKVHQSVPALCRLMVWSALRQPALAAHRLRAPNLGTLTVPVHKRVGAGAWPEMRRP